MARLPSLRFRGDRWAYSVFAALVGVWLAAAWANAWYVADRFAHHSVIVDATIVRTIQLGCFGARGSGTGMGSGDTIYSITFPHPGGVHATTVTRPCHVIPPDYGRGRGAVWIQYDVDNLDRTRVLNDTGAERFVTWGPAWILGAFGLAAWSAPRRGRTDPPSPTPGA